MQTTSDEVQKAGQGAQYVQGQVGVQIDQDALASAALIYGAIKELPDSMEVGTGGLKVKDICMRMAAKLSYNTLVPWYKGAALIVGDAIDI